MESGSGGAQTVAAAGFCDDVSRLSRVGFELSAEIADIHAQQVQFIRVAQPPHTSLMI